MWSFASLLEQGFHIPVAYCAEEKKRATENKSSRSLSDNRQTSSK